MNEFKDNYIRIKGEVRKNSGVFAHTKSYLYAAKDHLLQVENRFFKEQCKRFYLADIQSITVTPTPFATWLTLGLVSCIAVLGIGGYSVYNDSLWGLSVFLWIVAAPFSYPLFKNLYSGPSCTVYIITAAQTECIQSLGRVKIANKVLPELMRNIRHAQAHKVPDVPAPPAPTRPEAQPMSAPEAE